MTANRLPSLDFALGETADLLREQVAAFAAAEIAPIAAAIDRSNDFPAGLWRKMGVLGLLGITVEEDYGGALAMSEPGAGLDVVGMRLKATRRGDRPKLLICD